MAQSKATRLREKCDEQQCQPFMLLRRVWKGKVTNLKVGNVGLL